MSLDILERLPAMQESAMEALLRSTDPPARVLLLPDDLLAKYAGVSSLYDRSVTVLTHHEQFGPDWRYWEDAIAKDDRGFYVVNSPAVDNPMDLVKHAKKWFWLGQHAEGNAIVAFSLDHYHNPMSSFAEELKMLGMIADFTHPGMLEYFGTLRD